MPILTLALKSLWNRRYTALLTLFAITVSVALLLAVERVRNDARESFANTISGTDLIVGARAGSIQLLLYSVFRIGSATNNIGWDSYRAVAAHPDVAWTIPLSLGDSHRGYPVLGTTGDYFAHYGYARDRRLAFAAGKPFDDVYNAVLGAEVARALGYGLGESIVLAHGAGDVSFMPHADKPFTVVGILEPTGTPVDRTVHIRLDGMQAMHADWRGGAPRPGGRIDAERARQTDLTPKSITAALVGLDSRIKTFKVQRFINEYRGDPLLAILPGVALQELWDLMRLAERALLLVSGAVVLVGLTGMLTVILAGLNERRREMAILRSVGARPAHIFALLLSEAGGLALAGAGGGLALLYAGLAVARPWAEAHWGLVLNLDPPTASEWWLLAAVVGAGFVMGAVPAWRAYRYSLADGLTVRI